MMKQKYYSVFVIIAVVSIILISGCIQEETGGEMPMRTELYKGDFSVSATPILNRTVELSFNLESIYDVPNTTIKLILSEGIEIVEGNLVWNGDIIKGEQIEHNVSIRVVKEGEWRIRACVETDKDNLSGFNRVFFACLVSDENSGALLKSCPTLPLTEQPAKPDK